MIEIALCTAMSAPSKSDLQQSSIIDVTDPSLRAEIHALVPAMPWMSQAPRFLVFCGDNHRMRRIAEMRGKPVLISAATMSAFWPWLRTKFGFSDRQIRKYTHNLAPFIQDPNAIQEGYLTSEPYTIEKQAGFKPKVFLLADYGYPGYANMVLVPQKRIDTDRATVQGFVDATRLGWQRYLNNPAKGNALIKRDNPDMTDAILKQALDKMKSHEMVVSGDGKAFGLGSMTDQRWKFFYDTMAGLGLYPKGLDYKKAYDLSFVRRTFQNFQ